MLLLLPSLSACVEPTRSQPYPLPLYLKEIDHIDVFGDELKLRGGVGCAANGSTLLVADLSIMSENNIKEEGDFQWTPLAIFQSIAIFCLAGIAEIVGGYLVWASIKGLRLQVDKTHAADESSNNTATANESVADSGEIGYEIVKKPWWFALIGSIVLVAYGFIPCFQPSAATDGFARIYAAYGGFFIVMSFLLGWAFEGESAKPDVGDLVGGIISVVGALVIVFWPRR